VIVNITTQDLLGHITNNNEVLANQNKVYCQQDVTTISERAHDPNLRYEILPIKWNIAN